MREPESIRFEADYWRVMLDDLGELNALIGAVADALVSAPVAAVGAMAKTFPVAPAEFEQVFVAVQDALDRLSDMQPVLMRALALADGRAKVLAGELRELKAR